MLYSKTFNVEQKQTVVGPFNWAIYGPLHVVYGERKLGHKETRHGITARVLDLASNFIWYEIRYTNLQFRET